MQDAHVCKRPKRAGRRGRRSLKWTVLRYRAAGKKEARIIASLPGVQQIHIFRPGGALSHPSHLVKPRATNKVASMGQRGGCKPSLASSFADHVVFYLSYVVWGQKFQNTGAAPDANQAHLMAETISALRMKSRLARLENLEAVHLTPARKSVNCIFCHGNGAKSD